MRARILLTAALLAAGTLATTRAPAATGADYDDPKLGTAPCVLLNRYEATEHGAPDAPSFGALVEMENACGRTLEVALCLLYAEEVEGTDRYCVDERLRPWALGTVVHEGAPARITAPEYRWRYLPVQ